MGIVNYQKYCKMIDTAYLEKYAYPAINVCSIETANAALKGFAEAKSDGIIQVSKGGGTHASGLGVKDAVIGAISLANHIHLLADKYNINIALHTDHCKFDELDEFVYPLIHETEKRREKGLNNLFNSHMFDGSDIPFEKNLEISKKLMKKCYKNEIILEVEAGVVGGEEDGVNNENVPKEKLYTTSEDMLKFYNCLKNYSNVKFMLAATFGNVHGVYKPGNVKLQPKILLEGKNALKKIYGNDKRFYFVFHGGSGSELCDIHETLEYGVVKMNIDTDTQYAFTRMIADHMYKNYDGVLKVDNEVGQKKQYDPRSYLKIAEEGMAERVIRACKQLKSFSKSIG